MKTVPIRQQRVKQTKALMDLDDVEMTLELLDLDEVKTAGESRKPPSKPFQNYDALVEFHSAASMILDREEREALAREFESIFSPDNSRPIAA